MSQLPSESVPKEQVEEYLGPDERLVSSFGPYYATSRRVMLVYERGDGVQFHEIPYTILESITEVKKSDHRKMIMGAILVVSGLLTIISWYLVIPIFAVVLGLIVIFQGAVGKPAYYQLKGRGMEGRDLHPWQIQHFGAGSFIASISTMTGIEGPDSTESLRGI